MRHSDRRTAGGLLTLATALLVASPGAAGVFSPVSEAREVRADEHVSTVGYTCVGSIGGHPVPACPVSLGDVTNSDVQTAPGFVPDPFAVAPSVGAASASHASSIQPTSISISGDGTSSGSAAELANPPPYILVLQTSDRSTQDASTITVDLDEPTPFSFEASGRIDYPDPNFPVVWDVGLQISLDGPGGSVAGLVIAPDFGCPNGDPELFSCWVEPTPVVVTGTLPAGQYTLQLLATTSGGGSWFPSVGALGGFALVEYAASLTLGAAPPVPVLGPSTLGVLVGVLAGAAMLNSRGGRSE